MSIPHNATEKTDPEKFAALLVAYAEDPDCPIKHLAQAVGMPYDAAQGVIRRLQSLYQPVVEETRRVTSDYLVKKIEGKLPILLDAIDDKKVSNATLRDIAVTFGVLAEKRQLLKGEPTQILTYEERRNLNRLGPDLMKELGRRGMTIDVEYTEIPSVSVLAPDVVQEEGLSKTAAEKAKRENRKRNR